MIKGRVSRDVRGGASRDVRVGARNAVKMHNIHILVKPGCGDRDGEEVICVCNKVLKVCMLKEVVGM